MPTMFMKPKTSSAATAPKSGSTKLGALLRADDDLYADDPYPTPSKPPPAATSCSSSPGPNMSAYSSPGAVPLSPSVDLVMWSPWNNLPPASPYAKSPWTLQPPPTPGFFSAHNKNSILVGSLVREEGHVYSLTASDGLLYTGSESKNVRVWKKSEEFTGFKSTSGLVKAIVVTGGAASGKVVARRRVYTGHQDGKIRVWASSSVSEEHRRVGSLPRLRDVLRGSLRPGNYVQVRRGHSALWMRHHDVVSCLAISGDGEMLYSGSWDKTVKVWRLTDSKCMESITAHDDAVNAVATSPPGWFGMDPLLFTGSADGTVKAWKRDAHNSGDHHVLMQTLLRQECAVTSLAMSTGDEHAGLLPAVYSGSSDGALNVWVSSQQASMDRLAHAGTLRGHRLAVLCVVAAGGSLVLSGSADKTICVWRREAEGGGGHSFLSVLSGHQGPVKCLAVEADEEEMAHQQRTSTWVVYSGSLDKSVKVWKVSDSPTSFDSKVQQRDRMDYRACA